MFQLNSLTESHLIFQFFLTSFNSGDYKLHSFEFSSLITKNRHVSPGNTGLGLGDQPDSGLGVGEIMELDTYS